MTKTSFQVSRSITQFITKTVSSVVNLATFIGGTLRDGLSSLHFYSTSASLSGTINDDRPGQGTNRPPQPGRAYDFDGSNDHVALPAFTTTGDLSISFWINTAQTTSGCIVNLTSSSTTDCLIVGVYTGKILATKSSNQTVYTSQSAAAVNGSKWRHVVVTKTAVAAAPLIYIDGILDTSAGTASWAGTAANRIGSSTANTVFYDGKLFDSRVFNSVLTPAEVLELFELGTDAPNEATLLHLKCDDQHPTIAFDSSGNNLHGTKTSINAAVGAFHYQGADVPFSWQNEKGFTPAGWFDGVTSRVALGTLAGGASMYSFRCTFVPTDAVAYNSAAMYLLSTGGTEAFIALGPSTSVLVDEVFTVGAGTSKRTAVISTSLTFSKNVPVEFEARWNGSRYDLYIDGVLQTVSAPGGGHAEQLPLTTAIIGTSQTLAAFSKGFFFDVEIKTDADTVVYSSTGLGNDSSVWGTASTITDVQLHRIPRKESDKANNVLGQPLTYTGECPYPAKLTKSHCGTFDGVGAYVETGLNINNLTAFSVFRRVRYGTLSGTRMERVHASDNASYLLGFGQQNLGRYINYGFGPTGDPVASPAIQTGVNYAEAYTTQINGTGRLYVDGVEIASGAAGSIVPTANTRTWQIGRGNSATPGAYHQGQQWDYKIYNKQLSADEVLWLTTNGTQGTDPGTANLIRDYPFSEGAGTKIHDVSGNNNHGTANSISEPTFWGTTQNVYHRNVVKGYSKRTNAHRLTSAAAGWVVQASTLTDGITDPFGLPNALRVVPSTTATETHRVYSVSNVAVNGDYCVAYAKIHGGNAHPTLYFNFSSGSAWYFNVLTLAAVGVTSADVISIASIGNGWVRAVFRVNAVGTNVLQVNASNNNATSSAWTPANTTDGLDFFFGIVKNVNEEPYPTVGTVQPLTKVPAETTLLDALGYPITHPAGAWHNGAESHIDFTGGVAFPQRNWAVRDNLITTKTNVNVTATANAIASPDGETNGTLYTSTLSAQTRVLGTFTPTNGLYTISVYLKRSNEDLVGVGFRNDNSFPRAVFNLANGTIDQSAYVGTGAQVTSATIEDVGDGWYKCVVHMSLTAVGSTLQFFLAAGGYVAVTGDAFYEFGYKVEQGSKATGYSPIGGFPALETDWAFNTAHVNPKFHRTLTKNSLDYRADRFLNYDKIVLGDQLSLVETFTETKEVI